MNIRPAFSIRRYRPRNVSPFPSPGRSLSESLSDVLRIRRIPPHRFDPLPCAGWNPSVNLRLFSKLRRAHCRTIASHRSPAKPSTKRLGHIQAPKSLSATRLLEIKHRVEPSDRSPNRLQAPKSLSAEHRPAFQPRGTVYRTSGQLQDPEEPIHRSSTRLPDPWNRSPSFRLVSGLRGDLQRVIDPTHSSGWRTSTSFKTTERTRRICQRLIDPNPNSRKLINHRQTSVGAPKNLSKDCQMTSELPRNTSTNARFAARIRRNSWQSVVSLPRTQRAYQ